MQAVTVYHVDYVKKKKIPIGTVTERRKKIRPENLSGLLHVARMKYASNPQEAFQTAIDASIFMER